MENAYDDKHASLSHCEIKSFKAQAPVLIKQ